MKRPMPLAVVGKKAPALGEGGASRRLPLHIASRPVRASLGGAVLGALALHSVVGWAAPSSEGAPVVALEGPTPIPNGNARAPDDITLKNGRFAVSFSVSSQPPWGVARGGVLDLAIVRDGELSDDLASLVDFMPNDWSSWPTTFQDVQVLEDGPERGVVRTERDWHEVRLISTFTMERGSDLLHMHTQMINEGESTFEDLLTGYVAWADGGHLFTRPGEVDVEGGEADQALTDWTASYEQDWTLAFHAPFATHVTYEGQDQYRKHTLPPAGEAAFEGWLQVIPKGEVQPAVAFEAERKGLPVGRVEGQIDSVGGDTIGEPIIVVYREDEPYVWSMGKDGAFSFELPEGRYVVRATAENHSMSAEEVVEVSEGQVSRTAFGDLEPPGSLRVAVRDVQDGGPLDGRLTVAEGPTAPVAYLGRSVLFTDLEEVGQTERALAPGRYVFEVGHGDGFLGVPQRAELEIVAGEVGLLEVDLELDLRPSKQGWYGVDLHHHSDILDGVTPPPEVVRSQLAAGLDFVFLSDHDSSDNHAVTRDLAARRGVPFVPSMEVSPSWAHFNPLPLDLGAELTVDPSTAPVGEIFDDLERMGAQLIVVNHPYLAYGYFKTLEEGTAPGGFDPRFHLVELNANSDIEPVLERMYGFWDRGLRIYLSSGSDTHDVWTDTSGAKRMMVHIPGGPSVDGLVRSLRQGHAYATAGPLVDSGHLFGSEVRVGQGDRLEIPFRVMAARGLDRAELVGPGGRVRQRWDLSDAGQEAELAYQARPEAPTWFALIVWDEAGARAVTNPVWVTPMVYEGERPSD